jgi:hypothetical protein
MWLLHLQGWLRRYGLPYVHGCVWDRDCRAELAPPRVTLFAAGWMVMLDLPQRSSDLAIVDGMPTIARRWHGPRVHAEHVGTGRDTARREPPARDQR